MTVRQSTKSEQLHVVVDLGATWYRIGVADLDPETPRVVARTPKDKFSIVSELCKAIKLLTDTLFRTLSKVSVGCPGLVTESGSVSKALHIDLSGCSLEEELHSCLGVEVHVYNDAKLQALGFSCMRPSSSLFYIVLGTGVGGAFVDRGQMITGAQNFAGEVGHIPVSSRGVRCLCGRVDCLDLIASGWALEQLLGSRWYERSLRTSETDILITAGRHVAKAAALCAVLLNPSTIVLAGHISANKHFLQGFMEGWERRGWAECEVEFIENTWSLTIRGVCSQQR